MSSTNTDFGARTDATTVASSFANRIHGKTIIITGVNAGGVGGATATSLATEAPSLLILAGRSRTKVDEVIKSISQSHPSVKTRYLELDLSSQRSCRRAAEEILNDDAVQHVDLLINNAGVMTIQERTLSPEGIEMQFATNHIGHFLFTNLILPKIIASARAASDPGATRIVNVTSRGVIYNAVRFSDWNFEKLNSELPKEERLHEDQLPKSLYQDRPIDFTKPYIPIAAYAQSKTANVLFSIHLNKLLFESFGILSVAVHPGAVGTELGRHQFPEGISEDVINRFKSAGYEFKNIEQGASTSLVAALDPAMIQSATNPRRVYLADCQISESVPEHATNTEYAERLWELSEQIVGQKFR